MNVDYLIDIKDIDSNFLENMITRIIDYDFFKKGLDFYHQEIKKGQSCDTSFALVTRRAVREFEKNNDHGLSHSVSVYMRALDILNYTKNDKQLPIDSFEAEHILKWAAIFHDLSRFYGANKNHEYVSKRLAEDAFYPEKDFIRSSIFSCIERHDWFNEKIDGELEKKFSANMIVDIFRLADKTSIDPVAEIYRYYLTGKRYGTKFFDPNISIEDRFDFKNNFAKRDMITFFLLMFILDENSFFFDHTRYVYKEWAKNKIKAKEYVIKNLCQKERISQDQIILIQEILETV